MASNVGLKGLRHSAECLVGRPHLVILSGSEGSLPREILSGRDPSLPLRMTADGDFARAGSRRMSFLRRRARRRPVPDAGPVRGELKVRAVLVIMARDALVGGLEGRPAVRVGHVGGRRAVAALAPD